MVRTVMSGKWETVQLKGLDMFIYFIEHFGMTPEEALADMKEHGQDVKNAELLINVANNEYFNQKGLLNNFYREHPMIEEAFNSWVMEKYEINYKQELLNEQFEELNLINTLKENKNAKL